MGEAMFLVQAVLISLSGALSPGPMTAVTIGKGGESPHAGAFIAIGHGIVEFPLMIAIFLGVASFFALWHIKMAIAVCGGCVLIYMGMMMVKNRHNLNQQGSGTNASPLIAGILLAIGNPYFLVWWATVGAALIGNAMEFGIIIFILFMFCHWMCDFIWYYLLSFLSFKGGHFWGARFHFVTSIVCGIFLIGFGAKFLYEGMSYCKRIYGALF
ncbi:MAG: LysE family translocator [Spirochaetes bacterium]|nr:LysE family translocator [Spirochaetota bacterium]